MDSLSEKYSLTEKVTKALASVVKSQSDEEYSAWLESDIAKVIFDACKEKSSKADTTDEVIDALKTSTASVDIINNIDVENKKPLGFKIKPLNK